MYNISLDSSTEVCKCVSMFCQRVWDSIVPLVFIFSALTDDHHGDDSKKIFNNG